MGKQHGYTFEKEIGKSLEILRLKSQFKTLWYHKMVDTYAYDWIKDYMGDEPPRELQVRQTSHFKHEMILPKVPADYLVLLRGVTKYVECKSSQDSLGFPIANIKQHQLDFSREIEEAGAPYYFFLCKRENRNNVLYIVRASEMREMIRVLKSRKVIKSKILWSIIAEHSTHVIPKSRGCVYDLESFMQYGLR